MLQQHNTTRNLKKGLNPSLFALLLGATLTTPALGAPEDNNKNCQADRAAEYFSYLQRINASREELVQRLRTNCEKCEYLPETEALLRSLKTSDPEKDPLTKVEFQELISLVVENESEKPSAFKMLNILKQAGADFKDISPKTLTIATLKALHNNRGASSLEQLLILGTPAQHKLLQPIRDGRLDHDKKAPLLEFLILTEKISPDSDKAQIQNVIKIVKKYSSPQEAEAAEQKFNTPALKSLIASGRKNYMATKISRIRFLASCLKRNRARG